MNLIAPIQERIVQVPPSANKIGEKFRNDELTVAAEATGVEGTEELRAEWIGRVADFERRRDEPPRDVEAVHLWRYPPPSWRPRRTPHCAELENDQGEESTA